MEKFKTLNNSIARQIIRNACTRKSRAVYMRLFNVRDHFTSDIYYRLLSLVIELCPLTTDVFYTLPLEVQSYFSQLWLQK